MGKLLTARAEQRSDFEHLQIGSNCTCLIVQNFTCNTVVKKCQCLNKKTKASGPLNILVFL